MTSLIHNSINNPTLLNFWGNQYMYLLAQGIGNWLRNSKPSNFRFLLISCKTFFLKFEGLNSGCSLRGSAAACLQVFTVIPVFTDSTLLVLPVVLVDNYDTDREAKVLWKWLFGEKERGTTYGNWRASWDWQIVLTIYYKVFLYSGTLI